MPAHGRETQESWAWAELQFVSLDGDRNWEKQKLSQTRTQTGFETAVTAGKQRHLHPSMRFTGNCHTWVTGTSSVCVTGKWSGCLLWSSSRSLCHHLFVTRLKCRAGIDLCQYNEHNKSASCGHCCCSGLSSFLCKQFLVFPSFFVSL